MGNICKKKEQDSEHFSNLLYERRNCLSTENTDEYFKLIKLRMRKFYEENQHNQLNISISLDRKDFSSNISSKNISINPHQKFVYWKEYILKYLNKRAIKGYKWASIIVKYIIII
jgi:hypothetical protein